MLPTPKPESLMIRVDSHAAEPLQHQIYSGVRTAILSGVLRPGMRMPSSRSLATDLRVSRTTTLLALEQLVCEGYLSARRGSGTYVAQELPDDLPRVAPSASLSGEHPPLSRRGDAMTTVPPAARRIPGPPRAFRVGVPAVDLFPVRIWSQLTHRRLQGMTPAQLDYGDSSGLPILREAIAAHVSVVRGTRCDPSQIIVVAGAQHAMSFVCRLLLDPGDDVWLEEPGYPGARSAFVAAGARIHSVPVDADGLDVGEAVRRAGTARMVYVTPSHQFPLGVPMSLPRRLALLKWANAARAWVVEDDYDSEFRYGSRPIPCLHGLDVDGRVIYLGSFAKTVFPSLRLGFLIVPADLRDQFVQIRQSSESHPAFLDQAVLADFIQDGHFGRHLRRMQSTYRERLEAIVDAAQSLCGGALRIRPVRTGLHLVADLADVDADAVFAGAIDAGVEAMSLSRYYYGGGEAVNGLILGFGAVRPDDARRGMEKLASVIESVRRSSRSSRPPIPGSGVIDLPGETPQREASLTTSRS